MLDERKKNAVVSGKSDRPCNRIEAWENVAFHHQFAANPTLDSIMFANVTCSTETATTTAGLALVEQQQPRPQQMALRTGKNVETYRNSYSVAEDDRSSREFVKHPRERIQFASSSHSYV
jgi:hypothetical protein